MSRKLWKPWATALRRLREHEYTVVKDAKHGTRAATLASRKRVQAAFQEWCAQSCEQLRMEMAKKERWDG